MTQPSADLTWRPEDDNPESHVGADTHDLDRTKFPTGARFTDAQWRLVEDSRSRPR